VEESPWWEGDSAGGDEPVWISMLEHFSYCPRQFALIHLEQCYDDNVFTLQGREGHERVDEPQSGEINGVRFERALPLFSRKLGLTGKADLVEFPGGVPYPVEYKHGSRGGRAHAEIQLCAQALCLEEMLDIAVPKGALYAITTHRRTGVVFTPDLRSRTISIIGEVRAMLRSGVMPPAVNDRRCPNCSLIEACRPEVMASENRERLMQEWNSSHEPQEDL